MTKQVLLRALTVTCGLLVFQGCKSDTAKDAKVDPVLVLEAGDEPRAPLRYTIQDGSTTTSTMELTTSSMTTTTSAGAEIPKTPSLRFVVSSGPAIKVESGDTRFDIRIVKAEAIMPPGVDPEVENDFNRSAALLKDVGGWVEVDDRGIVQHTELNQAAKNSNVPARLLMTIVHARTSLARIILPAEPVGLGARWEARKELKIYGFEMQQVDRYTLTDKVGDEVKLNIEIVQTAPKQTLTFVEEGVEFALESLSMSAEGDVVLNLNALEGRSRIAGQSAEILTVKTVESTEQIERNTAFQLSMAVRYEASTKKAAAIEEATTKTTPGQ
ncbi:MAG: hypothetical protein ACERNK_06585 [Deltaproteobacteria bacterium]